MSSRSEQPHHLLPPQPIDGDHGTATWPTSTFIRRICESLHEVYQAPRHGNKRNPLDELVFIILSTRTQDRTYRRVYGDLKRAFPSWNAITARDRARIETILQPGGLARLKTNQILAIIRILRRVLGDATLAPLARISDEEAERFLTALPGVGKKVAKCVMMYSMGRAVLPVDVHVHRVAQRLGFKTKRRPDTSQDLIEQAVPPTFRYGFHVNAVAHGRAICASRQPACPKCPLKRYCAYAKRQRETRMIR